MAESRGNQLAAFLFLTIACLAAGGGLLLYGVRLIRQGQASRSWPTAPGVVRASRIRVGESRGSSRPTRSVHVEYAYAVGGTERVSQRAGFGDPLTDEGMRAMVERYPEGKRVTVAYDPADPGRAVLEPGVQGIAYWALFIGAVFLSAACLMIYTFVTRPRG